MTGSDQWLPPALNDDDREIGGHLSNLTRIAASLDVPASCFLGLSPMPEAIAQRREMLALWAALPDGETRALVLAFMRDLKGRQSS